MEICLFQPNIANNVGSIIRTSACMSVKKIHIIMPTGFIFDKKKIGTTALDYTTKIDLITHEDFFAFKSHILDKRIVLLTTKAEEKYYDFNFQKNDVLMLGNESFGTPQKIMDQIENQITIPMAKNTRSLNVATCGSIAISEAMRQFNYKL